jgi:RNA polymerase sigma-70 factor (ECF subfamily)
MQGDDQGDDEDPREPGPEKDTQHLAREAKLGDAQLFAQLYERIAPALYTWASLRIRPAMRMHVDPQDVVQEVWVRAWRAFPKFDPDQQNFRLWIFRIGKNVMLEAFRKVQRASAASAGAPGPSTKLFQLHNLPDSATNVSRRVARDEGIQKVLEWVEGLEEEDKKLFVHCGLEGLSYAEVSERMQIHYETVAKRWQSLRLRIGQFGVPKDMIAAE